MKIKYDQIRIEVGDLVAGLEKYAKSVMCQMQKAEPRFAYCWTACLITFNDLQPKFQFGSKEDLDENDGILVLCPLTK